MYFYAKETFPTCCRPFLSTSLIICQFEHSVCLWLSHVIQHISTLLFPLIYLCCSWYFTFTCFIILPSFTSIFTLLSTYTFYTPCDNSCWNKYETKWKWHILLLYILIHHTKGLNWNCILNIGCPGSVVVNILFTAVTRVWSSAPVVVVWERMMWLLTQTCGFSPVTPVSSYMNGPFASISKPTRKFDVSCRICLLIDVKY